MNLRKNYNLDYYQVAARLLLNALIFRACKTGNRPLKPAAVSLAVTNRCNSRCTMCNIWKSSASNPDIKGLELSASMISGIFENRLFHGLVEVDLTGGEPHLREDLVEIALSIARLKNTNIPGLKSIVITSNGFLTRRIIANYRDILTALQGTGIDLVAVISLDGIGEVHDKIRGKEGAYKLVLDTLAGLAGLKKEYPELIPGIKTTVLPQNISNLNDILDFALSHELFHIISPAIFTESRFRNMDRKDKIALTPADNKKLLDFYRRVELSTSYFYYRGLDYLETGKKQWVCAALYNYLFIDYDGQVYPCEIIPETLGNVKNQSIADIWNGPRAKYWRSRIGKTEYCRACHEPGAIRYSAVAEGAGYLKYLSRLGKPGYLKSLAGEGYSKYS